MTQIFEKNKKFFIAVGAVIGGIVIAIYFYCLFLSGVWHGDSFLYQTKPNHFSGKDIYAQYDMEILPSNQDITLFFAVDGDRREYRIVKAADFHTKIYENDVLVLESDVVSMGDWYYLQEDFESIQIYTEPYTPTHQELYPSYTQLYNWAVTQKYELRGNPALLIPLFLCILVLVLDIAFPNFFFILRHGLEVDGGEPSQWYRTTQKISQIIITFGILVLMIATFVPH